MQFYISIVNGDFRNYLAPHCSRCMTTYSSDSYIISSAVLIGDLRSKIGTSP